VSKSARERVRIAAEALKYGKKPSGAKHNDVIAAAMILLIDHILGCVTAPKHIVLKPSLVIRETRQRLSHRSCYRHGAHNGV
jgi:DNA-binding LacI/PurR family transcriptional regulator